jgi:hypothetical protein
MCVSCGWLYNSAGWCWKEGILRHVQVWEARGRRHSHRARAAHEHSTRFARTLHTAATLLLQQHYYIHLNNGGPSRLSQGELRPVTTKLSVASAAWPQTLGSPPVGALPARPGSEQLESRSDQTYDT